MGRPESLDAQAQMQASDLSMEEVMAFCEAALFPLKHMAAQRDTFMEIQKSNRTRGVSHHLIPPRRDWKYNVMSFQLLVLAVIDGGCARPSPRKDRGPVQLQGPMRRDPF